MVSHNTRTGTAQQAHPTPPHQDVWADPLLADPSGRVLATGVHRVGGHEAPEVPPPIARASQQARRRRFTDTTLAAMAGLYDDVAVTLESEEVEMVRG